MNEEIIVSIDFKYHYRASPESIKLTFQPINVLSTFLCMHTLFILASQVHVF